MGEGDEEGRLPQCSLCGFCGWIVNSARHRATQVCTSQPVTKRCYYQAKRQQEARAVEFTVAGEAIERVSEFRYLGRILTDEDDDNQAAARQLTRAQEKWGRLSRVLTAEGTSAKTRGYFYKAIVQAVLLYGSETWTLSESMLKQFESFLRRVA